MQQNALPFLHEKIPEINQKLIVFFWMQDDFARSYNVCSFRYWRISIWLWGKSGIYLTHKKKGDSASWMIKKTAFLSGIICLFAIKNIYCINIHITLIQEHTYYVKNLHKYFLHSQENNYQFLLYFDKLYIKPTNLEKKKFLTDGYLLGRQDVRFF